MFVLIIYSKLKFRSLLQVGHGQCEQTESKTWRFRQTCKYWPQKLFLTFLTLTLEKTDIFEVLPLMKNNAILSTAPHSAYRIYHFVTFYFQFVYLSIFSSFPEFTKLQLVNSCTINCSVVKEMCIQEWWLEEIFIARAWIRFRSPYKAIIRALQLVLHNVLVSIGWHHCRTQNVIGPRNWSTVM